MGAHVERFVVKGVTHIQRQHGIDFGQRVNVDGVLTNYGRLTSAADMTVNAAGINNYGTLGSAQKLTATTGAMLNDHGLIFSGGDMGLRVDSLNNRYASIYSLGQSEYRPRQLGRVGHQHRQ